MLSLRSRSSSSPGWNRGKSGRPKKGYASPEAFQKTFGATRKLVPIKASGGRVMLIEWRRRGGRWKPQQPPFLLVPRIRTPHRLELGSSWITPQLRGAFLGRVNENIGKSLSRIFGSAPAVA